MRTALQALKQRAFTLQRFVLKKYNGLYKRLFPTATIFLYHRIEEPIGDTYRLCVSRENFEEHVKYISKNYRVVSLSTLIEDLKAKTLKKNTAVITFDDGYIDNILNGLPILEKHGVPATIFAITGMLGQSPWWDKTSRIMSADEIRSLSASNTTEIGAHTMTHPHLSKQDRAEQEQELKESQRILQEILGKKVRHFAYPFGSNNDFNEDSVDIARELYSSACVNIYGIVKAHTDLFRLPRINIRNWDLERFKQEIR